MIKNLTTIGLMAGGAIAAAVVSETAKSSLDIDDAFISVGATVAGVYLASKAKGKTRDIALGASTILGMNAISDTVNYAAQKTANPMIDKLSELLPTVKATNVLSNPELVLLPEQDAINYEHTSPAIIEGEEEGINGLYSTAPFQIGVA